MFSWIALAVSANPFVASALLKRSMVRSTITAPAAATPPLLQAFSMARMVDILPEPRHGPLLHYSGAAVMWGVTAWKLPEVASPKRMRPHFHHRAQLGSWQHLQA